MPDPSAFRDASRRARTGVRSVESDQALIDFMEERLNATREEEEGDVSAVEDEFGDEFFWQDAVVARIEDDIKAIASAYDLDLAHVEGWFAGQQVNMVNYLDRYINGRGGRESVGNDPMFYTRTPQGINALFEVARNWVGLQFPAFAEAFSGIDFGRGSGGRGRSGPRRPTAAEIRAQFDVDQMVEAINGMSRGLVLAEEKNARSIANAYVNAIVANPEQELDFETFVRTKILNGSRAKLIYSGKPEALSHEQFLQPYVQAAQQMIGPGRGDQLAEIATAGARLGADPNAFRARLERTSQVQSSSPFLNKLGERMAGFRGVLRG